jgi:hypothetical protein
MARLGGLKTVRRMLGWRGEGGRLWRMISSRLQISTIAGAFMNEEDAWVSKDLIVLRPRSCLESMQSAESPSGAVVC